jgi:predicted amidohydrolase
MKILAAQINLTVGDLEGNFEKMRQVINTYTNQDLIVFPELAISGYPPLDLTERVGFCEEQLGYLDKLARATLYTKAAVIVGYFEKNTKGVGKPFYNALAVLEGGEIKYRYYKRLLPTYNIFDESRHFESGDKVGIYELNGVKLGLLICEDMWNDKAVTTNFVYPINPVEETAKAGVDLIVSINASPSNVGKPEYRLEKFTKIVKNYGVPLVYVNQVGGNDDIVFDGTSFAASPVDQKPLVLKSFEEENYQLVFDKDSKKLSPSTRLRFSSSIRTRPVSVGLRHTSTIAKSFLVSVTTCASAGLRKPPLPVRAASTAPSSWLWLWRPSELKTWSPSRCLRLSARLEASPTRRSCVRIWV